VTTVAAMPNTNPAADSVQTIGYIIQKASKACIKVKPVAAVTHGLNGQELTDFQSLRAAGAIAFSDDGHPVATANLMAKAMEKAQQLGVPVLAHCEDMTLTNGGIINKGEVSKTLEVKGIARSSENVGTAREIAIAVSDNTSVHICHVSTKESVQMIRDAKKLGADITAETCPHYFTLNDSALLKEDADYRMSPPLRSRADVQAVIEGIKDGTIDAIATDHAPHTKEEKRDFKNAPNGTVGLETSLAAGITMLVKPGHIKMTRLIELMSTEPAKILKVEGGVLKIGAAADIVIFSPNEKWIVDENRLHGKSQNTAFKGMELTGKVKYTICDGKLVYKD
jgi:dihydroorotase